MRNILSLHTVNVSITIPQILKTSPKSLYLSPEEHIWHEQRAMNMDLYTNSEFEDIHCNYDPVNGNGHVAVRLRGERYPTRWQLNHRTFARVNQNLGEHGSFRDTIHDTTVKFEMDLVA
ncbi:hypothetical protein TNCV_2747971 [Trichonephila clavipes]|nr:hypothetical protein TNCV_2747971 [Trichonephila clavipes]